MIPATLQYYPLFSVREGGAVEIMPGDGVIVLGGSCSSNRGNCPRGNCPTGVIVPQGNSPRV